MMSLTHFLSLLDIASAVDVTLAAGRHVESGSFSRPRVSRCFLTAMPSPSAERRSRVCHIEISKIIIPFPGGYKSQMENIM